MQPVKIPAVKRILWCLGAAVLLLAVCSKSSPLYPLNDWMDANIFYTMGKAMMNGSVLYRDVFDHKGPLLYLIYGLGWCVDHTGFFGVFLFEIIAFSAFLYWSLRTAELFAGPLHPAWALAAGAPVAAAPRNSACLSWPGPCMRSCILPCRPRQTAARYPWGVLRRWDLAQDACCGSSSP